MSCVVHFSVCSVCFPHVCGAGVSFKTVSGDGFTLFSVDDSLVAFDALTGVLIWTYTSGFAPTHMVGSAPTIGDGTMSRTLPSHSLPRPLSPGSACVIPVLHCVNVCVCALCPRWMGPCTTPAPLHPPPPAPGPPLVCPQSVQVALFTGAALMATSQSVQVALFTGAALMATSVDSVPSTLPVPKSYGCCMRMNATLSLLVSTLFSPLCVAPVVRGWWRPVVYTNAGGGAL